VGQRWRRGRLAHAALAAEMTHLGTQVFGAGLAPIHRTATRNARRLTCQA
jgi:hypothetical protein